MKFDENTIPVLVANPTYHLLLDRSLDLKVNIDEDEIPHVHQEHHPKPFLLMNLEFSLRCFHQLDQVDRLFHFPVHQV